jgi:dihydrodipicolinate synthase/N-acetylneuraminate lyase
MSHWEELRARIAGTIVPMTTPFTDSGELDLEGVRENTRFLVESGIRVISPLGSTGEFYTMTQQEHQAVLQAVCEEARGQATIIAGAGHSGTKIASRLAAMAYEAGADGTLVCVPYYLYDGAEGVYQHYLTIARENPGIGLVVYANREIMKDLSILERLASEPNIIGVKDATGDYALYRDECVRFRDRLAIVGGGSMQHYLWGWLWGSPGYFCSVANFKPQVEIGFTTYLKEDNLQAATTIVEKVELPFFEIAIKLGWWRTLKATMDIYGLPGGNSRLPNRRLTPEEREELVAWLEKIDLMP